jgi:hypothetical protein
MISSEKCIECGYEVMTEHSYCLNCGYKPIKPIISAKQKMLLMLFVFLISLLIIIVIVNNTSNETLSNVTNSINHNINKKINQPKQIDTDNNNQETGQVIILDKDHNSILNDSIFNNVLKSEDIVRCGDRYFKIKPKDIKLDLNGYEVIEFKNLRFGYNIRNSEDMTELERLNGLATEIKYNLSFDYFRNYIFRGLIRKDYELMIERAGWSNWSSTSGSLTNGIYSVYTNKQPEWSHNKSFIATKPACDEIIKKTDSNYYLKKYADQINQLNLLLPKINKIYIYYANGYLDDYWDQTSKDLITPKIIQIEHLNCFKADANGELDQERILFCRDSINSLKSEMSTYFYIRAINKKIRSNYIFFEPSLPEFRCKVEFTQIRGGEVVNVSFLDCPSDLSIRNKIESVLNKTLMPYAGFEDVFLSKVSITFCNQTC